MKFHDNIVNLTKNNDDFRREITTGEHAQVVLMKLQPEQDIGEEIHDVDQILVFLEGEGRVMVGNEEQAVTPGDMVYVPAGTLHNVQNIGQGDLKLYTIYAPPEHPSGTVNHLKAETTDAYGD